MARVDLWPCVEIVMTVCYGNVYILQCNICCLAVMDPVSDS
jgi:hypothetical protein